MSVSLVHGDVVANWDKAFAEGSDKRYPSLDLVRLERWFFDAKPGQLLEYGFGSGVNLLHMLECGYDVEAVDVSIHARELTRKKLARRPELERRANLHLIAEGDSRLPFDADKFDYVLCMNVLSLIGSRRGIEVLLDEFVRVMKPGAKIIVDVNAPNADFARNMKAVGDDMYVFEGGKVGPVPTYCPNEERFAELIGQRFEIDDIGYSAHKYMNSEITEHIICAHKTP